MRTPNRSNRRSRSMRGFTLAELVMSAGLTLLVSAAAMSLMWSVSRESQLTETERTAAQRGQAVLRRIAAAIHASRTVAVNSASQITIWNVDDYPTAGVGGSPGDDQPQVSEVETIAYDSTTKRITRTYVDFTGAAAATISLLNITLSIPGVASLNLATILSANAGLSPYTKTDVLAEDVQSCSFSSVKIGGQPATVVMDLTIGSGATAQTFHRAANLTGPAYFLGNSSYKSSDGLSGGRQRSTAAWTW